MNSRKKWKKIKKIKDDSISFYLLRKKISSNLQNFLLYSSDGKKETIKSEENKDIRDVEE